MEFMTIEYAASTSSTTSDTISGSAGKRSVRCVRLTRPKIVGTLSRNPATGKCGAGFGFSIRGGHEHGVGFFVSKIEPCSEAFKQGLQVGDQLMRVNGHRVDDAVHSELLHFIANQNRLKIKVRNVGMIPTKDHVHDPLTWHIVSELAPMISSDKGMTSTYCRRNSNEGKEMKVNILVPPKAKLGCGLCKGPEWRPGIFVQFTKENGLARKAGLRPGDQLIKCNGIDFRDIQFADAVLVMKKSSRLDLTVLPGVGNDLFSAESSGYNSSASSAAGGENSPSSSECKRLSIVTEEVTDLGDKFNHYSLSNRMRKHSFDHLNTDWKTNNLDFESDADMETSNGYQMDVRRLNQTVKSRMSQSRIPQNSTIINLSENGTTIQSCYDDSYPMLRTARSNSNVSQVEVGERKTVIVEVHQTNEKDNVISDISEDFNAPSESSYSSYANHGGTSLTNAIAEEFKRRAERAKDVNQNAALTEINRKQKTPNNIDSKQIEQHNALMVEFKKAHQRMFKREQKSDSNQNALNGTISDSNATSHMERQPLKPNSDISLKNNVFQRTDVHKVSTGHKSKNGPPAPPPLPPSAPAAIKPLLTNGTASDETDNAKNNNQTLIPDRPPSTPTPDYDTSTLEKSFNKKTFTNGIKESPLKEETNDVMKVNISASTPTIPKSPHTSNDQSLQNGTLKKSMRPISITIGEYPSNTTRKEPSKLDFLADAKSADSKTESEPIGSRLQSELVKTLSRSNLKKKTDALDIKLSQKMDNLIMDNRNFHMRYPDTGVIMSPPSITIPKITHKTVNGVHKVNINKDSLEDSLANLRKLKEFNANNENAKDVNGVNLKTLLPTFHQVTMVIKDSRTSPGN